MKPIGYIDKDTAAHVLAIKYTMDCASARAIADFIGPQPPCKWCGGYGEYETEHGPRGCMPCNSRLIVVRARVAGEREIQLDWGQWLVHGPHGFEAWSDIDFQKHFTLAIYPRDLWSRASCCTRMLLIDDARTLRCGAPLDDAGRCSRCDLYKERQT